MGGSWSSQDSFLAFFYVSGNLSQLGCCVESSLLSLLAFLTFASILCSSACCCLTLNSWGVFATKRGSHVTEHPKWTLLSCSVEHTVENTMRFLIPLRSSRIFNVYLPIRLKVGMRWELLIKVCHVVDCCSAPPSWALSSLYSFTL